MKLSVLDERLKYYLFNDLCPKLQGLPNGYKLSYCDMPKCNN
jgi:hypothetical protein